MRHFLTLLDYTATELSMILDRANEMAELWRSQTMPQVLHGKRIALWFYGQGFRNRVAFELGAREMGGTVAYIPGDLGVHEPIQDVAGYLQNWFSMFVIRAQRHEDLLEVAARSTVPVINARTDRGHPCEIMGDLLYLRQLGRDLGTLKLVFVGEPSNLCMSWLEAAAVFPMRVIQVCPPGYEISASSLEALRSRAAGHISVTHDLRSALVDADVVYTDCWPEAKTAADQARVRAAFLPYQITVEHLAGLGERGIFLPCPPVTRGEEVSDEAMQSSKCRNHEAKSNLLHVQNAIMEYLTTAG
jgi:ornithine carbamoyltransferase